MTRTKLYLILQGALCILLAALLAASAISICREGAVRKADHPLEPIYTREIAADRFSPIAPLFFASIGFMIAGLALGAKDENADKTVRDSELARDLIVARVAEPSEDMRKARSRQRLLRSAGWSAFAVCMLPVLVYLADPAHFPLEDLEGMFYSLIRVMIPWTAAGLGALAAASILREKWVLAETEAAQARIREEKELKKKPGSGTAPGQKNLRILQIALALAAIALILAGVMNGSARDVLYKAINVCTECVGLG